MNGLSGGTGVSMRKPIGSAIRDEMAFRGWTPAILALKMRGDAREDERVLRQLFDDPDMVLDVETAAGLERAFGISAQAWIAVDHEWHLSSRAADARRDRWRTAIIDLLASWDTRTAHGIGGSFEQAAIDLREACSDLGLTDD